MNNPIQERDWKYMRSIHDELLHALCARINRKAVDVAAGKGENPHKQYLRLYRYIKEADRAIADCFDDWRRSNISMKILFLRRHELLRDEHVKNFSEGAQEWLSSVEEHV